MRKRFIETMKTLLPNIYIVSVYAAVNSAINFRLAKQTAVGEEQAREKLLNVCAHILCGVCALNQTIKI